MIDSRNILIFGLLMAMITASSCQDRDYEKLRLERQRGEDSLANSVEGKRARRQEFPRTILRPLFSKAVNT
ncbi:hypothetical protein [Allomuricauda sp. CP2A]|uniref:hypothetical protein n=1 Tax=Allomuricauda sp. CP2A TaxID=1848189 RepID=UPI0008327E67|nr:hypothetical protein [Muricauda sp. CP2A]